MFKKIQFIMILLAILSFPMSAFAHRHERDLREENFRRIVEQAHELDEASQHAYARLTGRDYYRANPHLQEVAGHFAEEAHRFHEKLESYRASPWSIDEEANHLMDDAKYLRDEIRHHGLPSEHEYEDWDRVSNLLNEIRDSYSSGLSGDLDDR